jgi:hypothetical protein
MAWLPASRKSSAGFFLAAGRSGAAVADEGEEEGAPGGVAYVPGRADSRADCGAGEEEEDDDDDKEEEEEEEAEAPESASASAASCAAEGMVEGKRGVRCRTQHG